MSNKSKSKGNYGERRVAKLLMEFTGKNFRKTPNSGGFNKQGVVIAEHIFTGDVICDDAKFLFSVESKNRAASWSLAQLMCSPDKAQFTSWWYQTVEDAKAVSLMPMLFFKTQESSTHTVGAEHVALDEKGFDLLFSQAFRHGVGDVPYFKMNVFHGVKEIIVRDGKKNVTVQVDLPTPYIVNWRQLIKYADKDLMFGDK